MHFSSVARLARRNLLLAVAAVATMAAVVAAGLIVVDVADREDSLRAAETNLAELGPLAQALRVEPTVVVERGDATSFDLNLIRGGADFATRAARASARNWEDSARTAALIDVTERTGALAVTVVERVFRGEGVAAQRGLERLLPTAESLSGQVRTSRTALRAELDRRQSDVLGLVLLVSGLVGLGIVVLMGVVAAARRRGARAEAERQALEASEARLRALVRHGSEMVAVVGADSTVRFVAGAVRELLGCEPSYLEGAPLRNWVRREDAEGLMELCGLTESATASAELRFRHRDGSERTCEARASGPPAELGWDGVVLNVWDVSARKQLEERLGYQAFHDTLTGLANRALFADRLEQALRRGGRSGEQVTVLLIDLDDFKAINDSFGHPAGDRLLQEVASRLRAAMRAADTVARLGGDEFGVILDDDGDGDGGAAVERVFGAVQAPFKVHGRSFPITASVGVASSVPGETEGDHLVRNADLAMYAAKAQGKARWTVYRDDMYVAVEERLQLKADLSEAVAEGGQFELAYLPVVDLESDEMVGIEALVRWNHPERGQLSPADFIPLAEESGAIVPLGRQVLAEACRQGRAWRDLGAVGLVIGVNVSIRQLSSRGFVDDVREALELSGLPARQLLLEVTESQLTGDRERAERTLRGLKELGVWIAIDDFGTGYASLTELERLPVDVLKVNRGLARRGAAGGGGEDRLLGAVAEIGRLLQLRTVVEGVETLDHLDEAQQLHFPFAQGYVFARPMNAEQVTEMLRREPPSPRGMAGLDQRPVLKTSAE